MTGHIKAARARVAARVFPDTITFTHDPEGHADDTLDVNTMALTPPADDTDELYDGPCWVGSERPRTADDPGREPEAWPRYRVRLPTTAPAIPEGSVGTITASELNSHLVGMTLVVVEVPERSQPVTHHVICEKRAR